jgi:hypothetical protein
MPNSTAALEPLRQGLSTGLCRWGHEWFGATSVIQLDAKRRVELRIDVDCVNSHQAVYVQLVNVETGHSFAAHAFTLEDYGVNYWRDPNRLAVENLSADIRKYILAWS